MTRRPTYAQMCAEAISCLARRRGSSPRAIAKFLESRYGTALPSTLCFRRHLSIRLKDLVNHSLLLKSKASYKLTRLARRHFLLQSSKARQQQAVAPPTPFNPHLLLLHDSHVANTKFASDSENEASPSDGLQGIQSAHNVMSDVMQMTMNSTTSISSRQSSPPSSNNSATSSLSPHKRRRALLKQLLISLRSVDSVLQMTMVTSPACMRRRRLRRYRTSLLRPI